MLGQQVFDQRPVERIPFQPAQEQLAKGAQGRQGVAELVHEQLQLVVLLGQGAAQPLLLQIQAQGLGEAAGRGLEPLGQGLGPGPDPAVHPQGANQLGTIAQGQPATGHGLGQGGQLQGGGVGAGGQGLGRIGPLADRLEGGLAVVRGDGEIHHQGHQVGAITELGQLLPQQGDQAGGDRRHRH